MIQQINAEIQQINSQLRQQKIERALNNLDTFIAELKEKNNKYKGEQ